MFTETLFLLKKDLQSEFRQKAVFNSVLLYLVSTVFITYMVFSNIEDLTTWIAVFWIILIFAATSASLNSFREEANRQFYYYYSLCNPKAIVFSKLIYNAIFIGVISFFNFALFNLLIGNPVENSSIFSLVLFLGSLGIASTLTLTSAIASKTNNNSTLTAILSFPILLPTLLTAIKASVLCGLGFGWEECQIYLLTLTLLNIIIAALSYVLFPYLWRS